MATIALTGATGFVGGVTLERLVAGGERVRALARPGRVLPGHDSLEIINGSLESDAALENLVADCDAVIHLAGAISGRTYADFARTNVEGCLRLAQAINRSARPNARVVHVSTLAAREPGLSDYAASKRAGEQVITECGRDWVMLRPPAVYGPTDPALAPLWKSLARGWLPRIGSRQGRFSILHVDDLADALLALCRASDRPRVTCCLHDGQPGGYSWDEVANLAAQARQRRVRTLPVPRGILSLTARGMQAGARLIGRGAPVLSPGKVRELTHPDWVCDNTELPGCPDWKPKLRLADALDTLPGWSPNS